jgi:hypothetical protein
MRQRWIWGQPQWKPFWKVILPEIMPGIITGFLLAFTLSLDDFVISFFHHRLWRIQSVHSDIWHGQKGNKSENQCIVHADVSKCAAAFDYSKFENVQRQPGKESKS